MKIKDLTTEIQAKLANRQDVVKDIPRWVRDSVLDLTQSYPFEELRVKGPEITFTPGLAEYNINTFVNSSNPPPTIDKYTEMVTWFVELDSVSHVGFNLKYVNPQVIEGISKLPGIPCRWSRMGDTLIVGFKPQLPYLTYWRYQRQHPFSTPIDEIDPILMPDDWREIVVYAAAMRGATEKRMVDYVEEYRNLLYGAPDNQRRDGIMAPGLIAKRLAQRQRDSSNNERRMVPTVNRY